ncbi:gfo/Idh/MocA family oxidoreductase [Curtobacterium sp. MCBD17_019]|nr:gfo/Idh/MocA family oxidoreductase [Curtobacterium sp. MCBD17_019]
MSVRASRGANTNTEMSHEGASMPLTFGMIGASTIGPSGLLEPAARRPDVRVARVAARRPGAAAEYARTWDIPRASEHYEDVLADADVDAVYIANAAADHARWTIAALRAGKHVLCEKPIGVSGAEGRAIVAVAADSGRLVMEGFHYRFHPLFDALRALVGDGRYGPLSSISSSVNGTRPYDPRSILHVAALGGGALLHNGVYAVHWSRLLFDAEPSEVTARQRRNPSGADSDTIATLRFSTGTTASIHCSFDQDDPVSLTLQLAEAEVTVTGPIVPHHGNSLRVIPWHGAPTMTTVAGGTSFDHQLDAFVRRVRAGPADPSATYGRGDDIVANLDVVDAIRRAARSGGTEPVRR